MPTVIGFIVIATGAFVCWALKGFKGEFNDEMVGPYDLSSQKRHRNLIIGTLVIGLFFFVLIKYFESIQPEPKVIILDKDFKFVK
ncbi:hypothetical protein [Pontibacter pudoricolor]|uniref:hypothetical protein n=1 Tax=Pontibacter pudoricolor TaxID=2694930 RepID=UPI0013912183|nr:hypothetical protein [Pontibacter pudoricolor]